MKTAGRQAIMKGDSKGFTLIEVLVAIVLLGVGIVAVYGGLASLTRVESRAREKETLQRLAVDKFEEISSTEQDPSVPLDGDFSERGLNDIQWSSRAEPTGVENLEALTVTVSFINARPGDSEGVVTGLVFTEPAVLGGGAIP
jgi:general secretion pathway protein I